jgi:hypothetical protein
MGNTYNYYHNDPPDNLPVVKVIERDLRHSQKMPNGDLRIGQRAHTVHLKADGTSTVLHSCDPLTYDIKWWDRYRERVGVIAPGQTLPNGRYRIEIVGIEEFPCKACGYS